MKKRIKEKLLMKSRSKISFILGCVFLLLFVAGVSAFLEPTSNPWVEDYYASAKSPLVKIVKKLDKLEEEIEYKVSNVTKESHDLLNLTLKQMNSSYDWTYANLVVYSGDTSAVDPVLSSSPYATTVWSEIDLSSKIGSSKKTVLLKFLSKDISADAGYINYSLKAKGEVFEDSKYYNTATVQVEDGSLGLIVAESDDTGKVEWRATTGETSLPYLTEVILVGYID